MYYRNLSGETVSVQNVYEVDIAPEIVTAGKRVVKGFRYGWFPLKPSYPAAIFYLLGSSIASYLSNQPHTVRFTYYFEVRAKDGPTRDRIARELCMALSGAYTARRAQYDDSFEELSGTYIKRITFIFTIHLN